MARSAMNEFEAAIKHRDVKCQELAKYWNRAKTQRPFLTLDGGLNRQTTRSCSRGKGHEKEGEK